MASRYACVFPLSELINWIYHTRGQRHEELPHSYQMMLFWAGLRGAVGVALAAGITGDNADALRTTILVVVVLTVIVFGGTTARMLEVLGIRVGVEDEDASSDEEDTWAARKGGNLALTSGGRRYSQRRGMYGDDGDEIDLHSPDDPSPYGLDMPRSLAGKGPSGAGPSRKSRPNAQRFGTAASRSGFSTNSSESEEEHLPSATFDYDEEDETEADPSASDPLTGAGGAGSPGKAGMVFRDGQWFTALDERYLLPLFSNSVTARRAATRKTAKKASLYPNTGTPGAGGGSGAGTPRGASFDLGRGEEGGFEEEEESENGKNKMARTFR